MRKVKEVLRLRFELGLGQRQIARSCGMGLGTVHEYLERAVAQKSPAILAQFIDHTQRGFSQVRFCERFLADASIVQQLC